MQIGMTRSIFVRHVDSQRGASRSPERLLYCDALLIGNIVELPPPVHRLHPVSHSRGLLDRLVEEADELIRNNYGLVSFVVHPDYLITARAQATRHC